MCGNRLLTLVSPSATSSRASSGRRMNLFMRHALALAPALLIIALGLERVSRLPGNVCLTCSDGLLLGSRVACQFESHSLRQRVFSFRASLPLCLKNAYLAGMRHPRSTGEPVSSGSNASFQDFSLFGLWTVDAARRWTWRLTLNKRTVAGRLLIGGVLRPAAQIRGLAFAPASPLEYQNGRPANSAR
jgi:hypothetical protein